MLNRRLHDEFIDARKTHAQHDRARGLLLDPHGHVDLIGRPGYRRRLDLDFAEEARLVDPLLGQLQLLAVEKASLELANLAAHHLVAGARVADDVDPPHIDAPPRVDQKREGDLALFLVDGGIRVDVGKSIALPPQPVDDGLGRLGELFSRKRLSRLDRDQRAKLLLRDEQLASELHLGHLVFVALGDVDGDVNVAPVGSDRDLGRVDAELEVAAVQVIRAQRFEIGLQLLPGILVVLAEPGEPAGGAKLDDAEQFVLRKRPVADDVDPGDLCDLALVDAEIDRDAVALERGHGGRHLDAVEAAGQVLALELLLGLVEQRAVENTPLLESDVAQALLDLVLFEFLHSGELDRGDRRALLERHDQHVPLSFQPHVPEETRGEQGADRPRRFLVGHRVADLDGKIIEDGSRLDALDAFDADVAHDERIERPRRPAEHEQEDRGPQRVFH